MNSGNHPPQKTTHNGRDPQPVLTSSRDTLLAVKRNGQSGPLRLKTSVILPSSPPSCFSTTNLLFFQTLRTPSQSYPSSIRGHGFPRPPPSFHITVLPLFSPISEDRQLCSLVFSNFHFHWFSGRPGIDSRIKALAPWKTGHNASCSPRTEKLEGIKS